MVSTVGPVSKAYPCSCSRPARPPGTLSRSTTVTWRPAAARCRAQASPPRPAPTTTTRSVGPVTCRTTAPGVVLLLPSCRSVGRHDGQVGERRAGVRVDRRAAQRGDALLDTLGDERLDPGRRAGVGDPPGEP